MKLRIRTTFIGILMVAAVLPLGIALIAAQTIGYRSLRNAHGRLFQSEAQALARSFSVAVNAQLESLDDWVTLSDLPANLRAANAEAAALSDAQLAKSNAEIEARWPGLDPRDPFLRGFLDNEIARSLLAFRSVKPLFAEVFVTDLKGRLVGASGKTSDYWQADETWWQRAISLRGRHVYLDDLHYDASAGVYSLDVALPIRDRAQPDASPVGVIKGVINASPLLALAAGHVAPGQIQQVVLGDGRILARLSGPKIEPLAESITATALERLKMDEPGSLLVSLDGRAKQLVGFAPIRLSGLFAEHLEVAGHSPMFVLVYEDAAAALAPVRKQTLALGAAGALFILGSALAGYFLAGRKILAPIEALREAVQAIASSAKVGDSASPALPALPALAPLRRIRTGDELEELAGEFAYMAGRVLTYHERLESEIAAKTAAIDRDLEMAREFQEALMPRDYPRVPEADAGGAVSLQFQHAYKPASSVGGDFFDVIKVSENRAGIFIANVMGHGARSALVTAILRALLQNLAPGNSDPAAFLAALNRHFYEIVSTSADTIFVSAFYLIIDTQDATATYASAGHPAPFFADGTTGEIAPLLPSLKANPALGLFATCDYSQWSRAVRPGDLFLLYTDGIHEAYAPSGEEFGMERLREVIAANIGARADQLTGAVVAALNEFIQPNTPADDICLVSVRIAYPPVPPPVPQREMAANGAG